MANAQPDFGIYVYDAKSQTRYPIVNDPNTWEQSPMAIVQRPEPPTLTPLFTAQGTTATLIGAINVYDSTMFPDMTVRRRRQGPRLRGLLVGGGLPRHVRPLGVRRSGAPRRGRHQPGRLVQGADPGQHAGAPAAHRQVRHGARHRSALPAATPPRSRSGSRAARARRASAAAATKTAPRRSRSLPAARSCRPPARPDLMSMVARPDRASTTYTYDSVVGVPWDKALQPIFDAHCVDCHDGTAGAANPSYTITDMTDMTTFMFTFNLKGTPTTINAGDQVYTYNASYISMLGPAMAFMEKNIMVTGDAASSTSSPAPRTTRWPSRCSTRRCASRRWTSTRARSRTAGAPGRGRHLQRLQRRRCQVPAQLPTSTTC